MNMTNHCYFNLNGFKKDIKDHVGGLGSTLWQTMSTFTMTLMVVASR